MLDETALDCTLRTGKRSKIMNEVKPAKKANKFSGKKSREKGRPSLT